MSAEIHNAAEDGILSQKALKDMWLPPETARPYRVLTCVSKSVEAALALAGLADMGVSIITKTPSNLRLLDVGLVGLMALPANIAFDELAKISNHLRSSKRE